MKLLAALHCLMLAACGAAAEDAAPAFAYYEEEGGRVRDGADILTAETEAKLTRMLDQAEANYGQQMGVVTVPSLRGYAIDDFSFAYAQSWGLGNAERDDGLMLLIAPNEQTVRIEIGIGIEDTFPNSFAQTVIDDDIIPAFAIGDFDSGVIAGTEALVLRMRKYPSKPANYPSKPANDNMPLEDAA